MKKYLMFILIMFPLMAMGQKKVEKVSFEVNGVCGMCKVRIEKTALKIKGVKSAKWDIPTHQFTLLYDSNKVALDSVHAALAQAGHDTPVATAPDDVYENLPLCCLYEREKKMED